VLGWWGSVCSLGSCCVRRRVASLGLVWLPCSRWTSTLLAGASRACFDCVRRPLLGALRRRCDCGGRSLRAVVSLRRRLRLLSTRRVVAGWVLRPFGTESECPEFRRPPVLSVLCCCLSAACSAGLRVGRLSRICCRGCVWALPAVRCP